VLRGTDVTLDELASPTFIATRQREFCGSISFTVATDGAEAGVSVYMDERHRYDLAVRPGENGFEAILRLTIGSAQYIRSVQALSGSSAELRVGFNNFCYSFGVKDGSSAYDFGIMETRYVSSEVAGGFTGVMLGLYAVGRDTKAVFTGLDLSYE
jgi:alpha-N-arabinofuranosidase